MWPGLVRLIEMLKAKQGMGQGFANNGMAQPSQMPSFGGMISAPPNDMIPGMGMGSFGGYDAMPQNPAVNYMHGNGNMNGKMISAPPDMMKAQAPQFNIPQQKLGFLSGGESKMQPQEQGYLSKLGKGGWGSLLGGM